LLPYKILRQALFNLEPETSHHVSLQAMKWGERFHLSSLYRKKIWLKVLRLLKLHSPKVLIGWMNFTNKVRD